MISEMCVKYGSSGVKGQRPLRFLGDPKGAILTLRMALFEIAVTDGSTGGHYGLVSLMELAAHRGDHPIGLPPNGSPDLKSTVGSEFRPRQGFACRQNA